jgi:hypothetical protein
MTWILGGSELKLHESPLGKMRKHANGVGLLPAHPSSIPTVSPF